MIRLEPDARVFRLAPGEWLVIGDDASATIREAMTPLCLDVLLRLRGSDATEIRAWLMENARSLPAHRRRKPKKK